MTTSGGRRDLAEVRAGLEAWCVAHRPDVAAAGIAELRHPSSGLSNETIVATTNPSADGTPGPSIVVRLPPLLPSFPHVDLAREARVHAAITAAGIPTAAPLVHEPDPRWLGTEFVVLPFVAGTIPGPASLFDPWLTEATEAQRRDAQRAMVRTLGAIGRVPWRGTALEELAGDGGGSLVAELDRWDAYLRWATGDRPLPRIVALLRWCRDHAPDDDAEPSLVWGDPRLENVVFGDDRRVVAVLDWELATIGPAELDLGWYLGLERVLHELVQMDPLPGFATPDEVAADLSAELGRPLQDPAWHQVFAVVRSICVNVRQADIAAQAGVRYVLPAGEANPLIDVAERWTEEWTPWTS
ncbi:MAG: phosphotransferase family protein [Actinobacteria bacterium]|nr:phosphotransferase family protein [Actinomycetota bacterium]